VESLIGHILTENRGRSHSADGTDTEDTAQTWDRDYGRDVKKEMWKEKLYSWKKVEHNTKEREKEKTMLNKGSKDWMAEYIEARNYEH